MDTIANEDTAPSPAVTFTAPATKAAGLSFGNVPFGQHYGFWLKRIVNAASSAYDNDDWAYTIEGDTAA